MTATTNSSKEHIERHGYVVFRNVLTADECRRVREAGKRTFANGGRRVPGGGQKVANAAVELPEIRWLFSHPAILDCYRQVLGGSELMFTSHADLQKDVLNGWHKDDGTTPDDPSNTGYFQRFAYDLPDCRVYKCGVYLQDHQHDRHGLWIKDGSHRLAAYDEGAIVYTGTGLGDIVLFDVRITHTGQLKTMLQTYLLRAARKLHSEEIEQVFTRARKTYRDFIGRERIASFFTFGVANEYTVEFARSNMRRQLANTPGTSPYLPADMKAAFEKAGVKLAETHFADLV